MLTAKLYCYWLKSKKKLDFFHCTVLHLFAITRKPYDFENKPVYLKIYSDLYSFSKKFQPVEKLEILGALLLVYAYTRELNQALVVLCQGCRNNGFRKLRTPSQILEQYRSFGNCQYRKLSFSLQTLIDATFYILWK